MIFDPGFIPFLIIALVATCALALVFFMQTRKARTENNNLASRQQELEQQLVEQRIDVQSLEQEKRVLEEKLLEQKQLRLDTEDRLEALTQLSNDFREQKFEAEKRVEQTSARLEEHATRANSLNEELQQRYEDLKKLQEDFHALGQKHASLESSQAERDKNYQQQLQTFEEHKKVMEQSFQNLANKIFEEKGKSFTSSSRESIEQLLKPFREQITEFRARVDGIQKESSETTGSIRKELEHLRELNQAMTADARNLTQALKGDKKKVGSWGEIQLEKTLQQAGLVKGDHYDTQAHFKDQHGKNNYPDFVVRLPDNKHLVLDSKVSLVDYDSAVAAEDEEGLNLAMDRHVQAIRNHVDGLASKDYTNLIGMKSPSFVLMFMPIEPAYIEAMKRSNDLFNYGYQKNVILVSHTTLMPILRTVANLWMMERSNVEAREISDKAGEVFNQVCLVAERFQKLGATLQTASKHYNSAVVAIAGQQGLHGKVERFGKLSSKVTRAMPEIEPLHIDVESEKLEAVRLEQPPEPALEQGEALASKLEDQPSGEREKTFSEKEM